MSDYQWKQDPVFLSMPPAKMQFLERVVAGAATQNKKQLVPYFTKALQLAKQQNIFFTDAELSLILEALTPHMSPAEKKRMQLIQSMMKAALTKQKRPE